MWVKIAAFFAVVAAGALAAIKVLSGKNKRLKREVELNNVEEKIEAKQYSIVEHIKKREEEAIERKAHTDNRSADDLNRL